MIPPTVDDFRKLGQHYCDCLDELGVELPPETSARIALALCELIFEALTPPQKWAVAQARLYWSGQSAPRFNDALIACSSEIDRSFQHPLPADAAARSRLTFSAVNTCTPFDGTASGYLIGWGRDAGVKFADLAAILASHVGDLV